MADILGPVHYFTCCGRSVHADLVQSLDLAPGDDAKVRIGREGVAFADVGQSSSKVGGLDNTRAEKELSLSCLEEHCESVALDRCNGFGDVEEKVFFCHISFFVVVAFLLSRDGENANGDGSARMGDIVDVYE